MDFCGEEELVLQHIMRMEHVANWGRQYDFVPKIIEDKRIVYKHPIYDRVMLKDDSGFYYLDGVDWKSYKRRN